MQALDPEPLRDRLRRSTAERHASLDALVAERPFASVEAYAAFLLAQGHARARLAEHFGGLAPDSCWATRLDAHAEALAADLHALGVLGGPGARPVGLCADPSAGWGLVYVLEGSMLGGKVIARHLRSALGATTPAAFLSQGSSMRALADDLDRCDDPAVAVAAARTCFDVHLQALSEPFDLPYPLRGPDP